MKNKMKTKMKIHFHFHSIFITKNAFFDEFYLQVS